MKKLFLIDGNAIIHRAYHAFPPFKTTGGELVNAVYGFSSMLLNIINHQKPDYIAASFDRRAKTFRHEEYKEYKATRAKAPDDLYAQIPRIKQVVEAFNIPIYEMDGYEADDILGTLAKQAESGTRLPQTPESGTPPEANASLHTFIVTGDMDTLQLVSDKVSVFAPHKGFNDTITYTPEKVIEKYGLSPSQIVDYKALKGDPSDNIPGVLGVGDKTAVELLKKYKTLDGIYENIAEIKGALHDKLSNSRESAYFSQHLATLVLDVPVTLDLSACATHEFDRARVIDLFTELEFKSLLGKFNTFDCYCASCKNGIAAPATTQGSQAAATSAQGTNMSITAPQCSRSAAAPATSVSTIAAQASPTTTSTSPKTATTSQPESQQSLF